MADYAAASGPEQQRMQVQRMIDNIQVAMPVKVVSFDASTGCPTASVLPLTMLKVTLGTEVTFKSLPIIENVPVIFPFAQGKGLALTLPIQAGDTGFYIIPDKGLDNFMSSVGDETPPPFTGDPELASPRAHSLADGVFIPGLSVSSEILKDYNLENIELRDKDRKTFISLGSEGIEISDSTCTLSIKNGEFKVSTPKNATIQSANMNFTEGGNSIREGLKSETGTFIDKSGVSLNTHIHSGIEPGSGSTEEPVK